MRAYKSDYNGGMTSNAPSTPDKKATIHSSARLHRRTHTPCGHAVVFAAFARCNGRPQFLKEVAPHGNAGDVVRFACEDIPLC